MFHGRGANWLTATQVCCSAVQTSPEDYSGNEQEAWATPVQAKTRCKSTSVTDIWKEIHGSNNWSGLLEPMSSVMRKEILRYGEFAQVCYDSFDSDTESKYCGSCKYNKKKLFQKVGMGNNGYKVTKYIYATSEISLPGIFHSSVSEEAWCKESNWMGYVAVCTAQEEVQRLGRRDIVVAWRGTKTALEWIEDLKDFLIPVDLHPSSSLKGRAQRAKVERGFLSVYTSRMRGSIYNDTSARGQLVAEIYRLMEVYKDEELSITFTGHSLGAALAVMSAFDIALLNREYQPSRALPIISVFTFGCPRVGNWAFKKQIDELGVKVLRVVNVNDIVPKVPGLIGNERLGCVRQLLDWLPWTYCHVGVPLYLNNKHSPHLKRTQDLGCLHNLEGYLHLVDGYQGRRRPYCSSGRDPALVNKAADYLVTSQFIPPKWWQQENKGLFRNKEGRWVLQDREEDDLPINHIV